MEVKPVDTTAFAALYPAAELDKQQTQERRELIRAVKAIDAAQLFGENNEVTFVLDRVSGRPLMRIVDRRTQEVIRQLPPEDALRLAAQLQQA